MGIKIELRPQERILYSTYLPPFEAEADSQTSLKAILDFAKTMNGLFFVVTDVRQIDLSFSDLVLGMSTMRELAMNVQMQIVAIGSGDMLKFAADAARQKQYGQHNVVLVATPEEALNHVANERKRLGV
jgi:hypothetical protein